METKKVVAGVNETVQNTTQAVEPEISIGERIVDKDSNGVENVFKDYHK